MEKPVFKKNAFINTDLKTNKDGDIEGNRFILNDLNWQEENDIWTALAGPYKLTARGEDGVIVEILEEMREDL